MGENRGKKPTEKTKIRSDKIKAILMNLTIDDFCHTVQNKKEGYDHGIQKSVL